jgi:eukaryotic-like serine/threonine-protein kinase
VSTPTEVAGRYVLDRRLGAGGMSTVFLAQDSVLERPVAVKLLAEHLAEDEAFVARFRREALAAAKLTHPNIVQVFDSGRDEASDRHYIVMEYVNGPSCADLLREHGQLEVEQSVRIVRDACHGLDYAHRAGVVHRDVKPGNLLIAEETGSLKLADFGIAKAAEQTRITQVGSVLGTAAYLSPEQAVGEEAEAPSDLYSLGVCAYQLLTGRLPHEYSSLTELALKQQNEGVEPIAALRPEVPAELDRAIRVALERDPAARYSNALEMAEALEAGLHGEATAATQHLDLTDSTRALPAEDATQALPRTSALQRTPPPPPPARPPARRRRPDPAAVRRRRLGAIAVALAVLLAAAAVALAVFEATGTGPENINEDNASEQVDKLREYIRDHDTE